MKALLVFKRGAVDRRARSITALLLSILIFQTSLGFMSVAQASQRAPKKAGKMSDDQRIAHVLSRLTFGARPGDLERVKAMGVEAFINQQLDPDSIDNTTVLAKLRRLPTIGMATPVIIEQYTPPKPVASPSPSPAKAAENSASQVPNLMNQNQEAGKVPALPNAMQSEMQMNARKEDAGKMPAVQTGQMPAVQTGQMPAAQASPKPTPAPKNPQMVVTDLQRAKLLRAVYSDQQLYEVMVDFWENHFSIFANKDDDRYLLTAFDRETIRPFAMGRFRDLLGATAHSPAMLFYLDNWRSSVPRPYPAKGDKPAGVDGGFNENYARELMELHTLGVDGGYTQKDVQEVARCFSGWTIQKPNEQGLFLYRPGLHDDGEKVVLGHKILAGGGIADGERVLDILATHPATAKFIATKLARRFISDDPPQSVIDRAAAVFLKTDGSIRETLRAIVTSPEFFSPAAYRAKTRSPLEFVAASLRALNAETDGDRPVLDFISRMGQPLFGRITPDGYSDRAEQWLSSGAMIARLNFASALATNRIKGTSVNYQKLFGGADESNKEAIAIKITQLIVPSDLSDASRAVLDKVVRSDSPAPPPQPATLSAAYDPKAAQTPGAPVAYVSELVTLLIGSPEFQHR
jgi:uncharacterized protein (DUF1800 family)